MKLDDLSFNFLSKEFGKIDVDTEEHFVKIGEEYTELDLVMSEYGYGDEEEDRKKLCDEALDSLQANASFVSHLIHAGIMQEQDLIEWQKKMEDRKKKYGVK